MIPPTQHVTCGHVTGEPCVGLRHVTQSGPASFISPRARKTPRHVRPSRTPWSRDPQPIPPSPSLACCQGHVSRLVTRSDSGHVTPSRGHAVEAALRSATQPPRHASLSPSHVARLSLSGAAVLRAVRPRDERAERARDATPERGRDRVRAPVRAPRYARHAPARARPPCPSRDARLGPRGSRFAG